MVCDDNEMVVEEIVLPFANDRGDRMEFSNVSRGTLEPRAQELTKECYRVCSLRKDGSHCHTGGVGLQAKWNSEIRRSQQRCRGHDLFKFIESTLSFIIPMKIVPAKEIGQKGCQRCISMYETPVEPGKAKESVKVNGVCRSGPVQHSRNLGWVWCDTSSRHDMS